MCVCCFREKHKVGVPSAVMVSSRGVAHSFSMCPSREVFPSLYFLQSSCCSVLIDLSWLGFKRGVWVEGQSKTEEGMEERWWAAGAGKGFWHRSCIEMGWKRWRMVQREPGRWTSGRECSSPPPRVPEKHSSPQQGRKEPEQENNTFYHQLIWQTWASTRHTSLNETFSMNIFKQLLVVPFRANYSFSERPGQGLLSPRVYRGRARLLAQRPAISTENSIINLNTIATIFKRTNMKGQGLEGPVPFVPEVFAV